MRKIGSGSSAEVWDIGDNKVLKAYLRKPMAHGQVSRWDDHDLLTKVFFRKEIEAYGAVIIKPGIRQYFPSYFGTLDPCAVLRDSTEKYVSGCGFVLSKIPGRDVKLVHLPDGAKKRVEKILWEALEDLKEINVWDASCFYNHNNGQIQIIDFGLWDGSAEYECQLCDYGTLTDYQRNKLYAIAYG